MSAAPQMFEQLGDTLSPSTANQYLGCGAKIYFRKVERLPDPPTGALAMGSAVHYAIGANFAEKCDTHQDLPIAGVVALYHEGWDKKVKGQLGKSGRAELPVEFRDDERPDELRAQGEILVRKYMDEAAPAIDPAAVELHVVGRIGGVMVHGWIDLIDASGKIIDLKTGARKPSEISSDYRFQVATYVQITPGASGAARVDTLVKTKTPQLIEQSFTVEASDVSATERLYPLVQRSIRGGVWLPNRNSNLCSRKYCGFWRACERTFGGKVGE